MPRLKIVLIASFVILGVVLVLVFFVPMVTGPGFTTEIQESTLRTDDKWIISIDIFNHQGEDITYIINWSSGENNYTLKVPVLDGRRYTNIYHASPDIVKDGKLRLTIYREGESTPVQDTTYHISFD